MTLYLPRTSFAAFSASIECHLQRDKQIAVGGHTSSVPCSSHYWWQCTHKHKKSIITIPCY